MSTASLELQPNLSRLSNALQTLSEEIPRLANSDTLALLTSLEALLHDFRRTMVTKGDLENVMDSKFVGIEGRLDSIDLRLRELGLVVGMPKGFAEARELNASTGTQMKRRPLGSSGFITPDEPPPKIAAQHTDNRVQGQWGDLAHGPMGAFLIVLATLVPLFVILVW